MYATTPTWCVAATGVCPQNFMCTGAGLRHEIRLPVLFASPMFHLVIICSLKSHALTAKQSLRYVSYYCFS